MLNENPFDRKLLLCPKVSMTSILEEENSLHTDNNIKSKIRGDSAVLSVQMWV